ncbi:cytochrome c556 [Sphingomonas vulcanisoli]|uniref:Cytochrome c556 n=1 Tax=Sphingomonas vulcanisoli TaxID=1658060 RepID=A0ABX0TV77_9SPHN|nr:hypothetical protein [Sphingomonas vulcanisoli]NIJ09443.1 cytochrome c556 [Sphingomonas vulcanisoli]
MVEESSASDRPEGDPKVQREINALREDVAVIRQALMGRSEDRSRTVLHMEALKGKVAAFFDQVALDQDTLKNAMIGTERALAQCQIQIEQSVAQGERLATAVGEATREFRERSVATEAEIARIHHLMETRVAALETEILRQGQTLETCENSFRRLREKAGFFRYRLLKRGSRE